MNPLKSFMIWFGGYLQQTENNVKTSVKRMKGKDWIRLAAVVCVYLLIRPYLVKMGVKVQEAEHRKAMEETERSLETQPLPPIDKSKSKKERKKDKKAGEQAAAVENEGVFASGLGKEKEDEMRRRWKEEVDSDAEIEDYVE